MIRLEKYHGLGNDFLVLLDLGARRPVDAADARALCDRHRGVGADGLIRVTPGDGGAQFSMELYNADGSRAEMSGNGIRCLAMALFDAGLAGHEMLVHTDAGDRLVSVDDDGWARVDMGPAKVDPKDVGVAWVDMGNPHTVVEVEDLQKLNLARRAAEWKGRNVEFIVLGPEREQGGGPERPWERGGGPERPWERGGGPDVITMRVWERGVGETMACGTGACAAAAAAFVWGRVGPQVVVHQPGGDSTVELKGETMILSGPAMHVATVEVPRL